MSFFKVIKGRNRTIKITETQIQKLYILYSTDSYSTRELSKILGISKSYVQKLIAGEFGSFGCKSVFIRFTDKYIPEPLTGCWLWTGGLSDNGYGNFYYGGKLLKSHRFSWYFHRSNIDIPEGYDVCHKCDVRSCVNPEHLFIGTRKDNMQDAKSKGRLKGQDCMIGKYK